jgi:hypothetical protein
MNDLVDILLLRTWWTYARDGRMAFSVAYHWFNLFEAAAWFVFAALVLWRYFKHRHSPIELAYAFAFFTFGLTDVREAWVQQSWLIWLKLVNLIALFYLRRLVLTKYYPGQRLY